MHKRGFPMAIRSICRRALSEQMSVSIKVFRGLSPGEKKGDSPGIDGALEKASFWRSSVQIQNATPCIWLAGA